MAKLLFVSATLAEINPFLEKFSDYITFQSSCDIKLNYNNHNIHFLVSNPGMVSTAYATGKALGLEKYDFAVNAGITGAFDRKLQIGETVYISKDFFPELGADDGERFISIFDLHLIGENEFPFKKGALQSAPGQYEYLFKNLKKVTGITVNTVGGNEGKIEKIRESFNPQTESMEGAAFLYSCLSEKVPCVQIRSISNYVEKRNKNNWDIPLAIKNLNEHLIKIVDNLKPDSQNF